MVLVVVVEKYAGRGCLVRNGGISGTTKGTRERIYGSMVTKSTVLV